MSPGKQAISRVERIFSDLVVCTGYFGAECDKQLLGCLTSAIARSSTGLFMTAQKTISTTFRIAVAQLNPTVGDIAGNLAKARDARADAARSGADLLLLTELFISGYPPEDLVLKPAFLKACQKAVDALAADTADGGPGVIVGYPRQGEAGRHNSVAVLDGGKVLVVRDKLDLPNYGEFDEKRVFTEGAMPGPVNFRGVRLGIPICEEIWNDMGVCETLAESGAEILLVPNGSPYYRGKIDVRHQVVLRQVIETGLPMVLPTNSVARTNWSSTAPASPSMPTNSSRFR